MVYFSRFATVAVRPAFVFALSNCGNLPTSFNLVKYLWFFHLFAISFSERPCRELNMAIRNTRPNYEKNFFPSQTAFYTCKFETLKPLPRLSLMLPFDGDTDVKFFFLKHRILDISWVNSLYLQLPLLISLLLSSSLFYPQIYSI